MKRALIFLVAILTGLGLFAQDGYEVGDAARDFELKNIDGKMVSLADYPDAKGFIVIFTCNHCPYSKMYEDRIIALNNKFEEMGYPVIAINPNDPEQFPEDSYENMKIRAEEKGFTFPYLFDETQEIAKTYGAARTPHVFLLDREGSKYKVAYIGAIDDNSRDAEAVEKPYLEDAVMALHKDKQPEPDFTKAIGCSIKWRE